MIHHITRATRQLIFWGLIIAALALTTVRVLLVGVDEYKSGLEIKISDALGAPVKLGGLGANMRGITPELVLKNIDVVPALLTEEPPIHIREIRWGIHLGEYLLHRELLPSSALTITGAELSVFRGKDGHIGITGLKPRAGQPLWLFQGHYHLLDSRINWQDQLKQGNPIQFENMNVAVVNDGDQHNINALTQLPAQYGGEVKFAAELQGAIDEPAKLKGIAYLEGQGIHLPDTTAGYLPVKFLAGAGSIKLWARWQSNSPLIINGLATLQDAVLAREGQHNLPVKTADADFQLNLEQNGWRADVHHFRLQTETTSAGQTKTWPDAVFNLAYYASANALPVTIKSYAQNLDIAEISLLAGYLAPSVSDWLGWVKSAEAKGILKEFSLYAEPENKQFALAGKFQTLSVNAVGNKPGISHLDGRVKGSDTFGVVELNAADVVVTDAAVFSKPLFFNKIKGRFEWKHDEAGWRIASPEAELAAPAFTSESRFSIFLPPAPQPPFIDLQMAYSSADASQLKHYLPAQVMHENLKNWLSNAFLGGSISNGQLVYYGEPGLFPFTDHSGVFQAAMDMADVQLKFHPDWLPINHIKGRLTLDKDLINGTFTHGQIGKADIQKAEMTISAIDKQPELHIEGESASEIGEALKVLQQSPLASRVTPLMTHAKLGGKAKVALNLTVPFSAGQQSKAEATALLSDAELTPNEFKIPVNKLNGEIKFNEQGAFAKSLRGTFLGSPAEAEINSVNQQTRISVNGKTSIVELLKQNGPLPENIRAQGESAFHLDLLIPSSQSVNPDLQVNIRSDLDGVELALPGGLTKDKRQKKPFALAFNFNEKSANLPIKLNYNNELKAALNYTTKERKVVSGHILIGSGAVNIPANPGFKLEVNRTPLALQDWLRFNSAENEANLGSINEVALHSHAAFWDNTRIGEFDLTLKRNPSFWSGEIDSIFAKGVFDIPLDFTSFKPMVMTLDMINLSALRQLTHEAGETTANLKILPTISSNKTLWRSGDLGRLSLETERMPGGVRIKRLTIDGPDETLAASGTWEIQQNSSFTQLQGKLSMNRADLLFNKLNITKDFTQTSGNVNFQLRWSSPPLQLALASLRGEMDVSLKSGRILSIEPGFGRVLGILALEQWIKRLQLDFSDIFEEGLTYNSIKGDFNLINGKATTKNLLIDAVPARITILGDTDLVNQTVDHRVKVVPKSSDAVPIAGTIVGKVANLIGKTITGKDQDGFFFGREYLVKGNWNNASIKPLHENDGILQKTWNNLTDFPWVK